LGEKPKREDRAGKKCPVDISGEVPALRVGGRDQKAARECGFFAFAPWARSPRGRTEPGRNVRWTFQARCRPAASGKETKKLYESLGRA